MDKYILDIWAPRWHDRTFLPACHKVRRGKVYVRFPKAKSMPGLYSFDGGRVIDKCKKESNGTIDCYVVPLSWLVNEAEDSPPPEEKKKDTMPKAVRERLEAMAQITWEDLKK